MTIHVSVKVVAYGLSALLFVLGFLLLIDPYSPLGAGWWLIGLGFFIWIVSVILGAAGIGE